MKSIITVFAVLITFAFNAQNFQGKAIYKTSSKSNFKIGDEKGVSDKMQEELRKRIQKMSQKTFVLEFDKHSSTYKEEVQLEAPKPQLGTGVKVFSFGGSGASDVYFKNVKENRFANQTEIQGKRFLVKDTLPSYSWELSSETKNIGNYTCYKATFSKEEEKINHIIKDGESVEEKKKETVVTTAWYTTQIPVNNGPKNYQGLPGFVLEINDGKTTIVCTEIILNPSEKNSIDEPLKGKVVSLKEYHKIKEEKTKEMMEKFKSRNGFDIGNGINIKMGG
ncbi:GLPGLI family protein [Polaribacter pectinis]|uniref:GLPGLI family protein n=1 Tax=Polaribacter pectinis TaxID=2738844 RepID=A0A7G9LAC0_9FLAO|nr:GLPGLI family protein [Polaribacter pectinis]QNM85569.1 GLPGLI family protein [Polaribacter pectinis]